MQYLRKKQRDPGCCKHTALRELELPSIRFLSVGLSVGHCVKELTFQTGRTPIVAVPLTERQRGRPSELREVKEMLRTAFEHTLEVDES